MPTPEDLLSVNDCCSTPPTPATQTLDALSQPQLSFREDCRSPEQNQPDVDEESQVDVPATTTLTTPKERKYGMVSVEKVDKETGKVLQVFPSIANAAKETGVNDRTLAGRVREGYVVDGVIWRRSSQNDRGSGSIRTSKGGLKEDSTSRSSAHNDGSTSASIVLPDSKTKHAHNKAKAVEKVDAATGVCVETFSSIRQAAKHAQVQHTLLGQYIYQKIESGGYFWRFQQDLDPAQGTVTLSSKITATGTGNATIVTSQEKPRATHYKAMAVEKVNATTGKCVETFSSIRKAAKHAQIEPSALRRCIDQKSESDGYLWRFKNRGTSQGPTTVLKTNAASAPSHTSIRKQVQKPEYQIQMIDTATKNILKSFSSFSDASKDVNIPSNTIFNRLTENEVVDGIEWRRVKVSPEGNNHSKSAGKPNLMNSAVDRKARLETASKDSKSTSPPIGSISALSSPFANLPRTGDNSIAKSSFIVTQEKSTPKASEPSVRLSSSTSLHQEHGNQSLSETTTQTQKLGREHSTLSLMPETEVRESLVTQQATGDAALPARDRTELPNRGGADASTALTKVRDYGEYQIFRTRIEFDGPLGLNIRTGQPPADLVEALDVSIPHEHENNCSFVRHIDGQSQLLGILESDDWIVAPIEGSSALGFHFIDWQEAKRIGTRPRPFSLYFVRKRTDGAPETHSVDSKALARDKIAPFCAFCREEPDALAVHHPWCPKHQHSGGASKFERICRGVLEDCVICTEEFKTGTLAKSGDHTCRKVKKTKTNDSLPRRRQEHDVTLKEDESSLKRYREERCTNKDACTQKQARKKSKGAGGKDVISKDKSGENINISSTDPGTTSHEASQSEDREALISAEDTIWSPCTNPWGPIDLQDDDIVVFAPLTYGIGHLEVEASSERFVEFPFSNSRYTLTHFTPEEKSETLMLIRDPSKECQWGFSFYRHDFGGACLVKSVDDFSPASSASYFGAPDRSICLHPDDMILGVNGKAVGCMTVIGLEIELATSGEVLCLHIARSRSGKEKRERLRAEERQGYETLDQAIGDKTGLDWVDLWSPEATKMPSLVAESRSDEYLGDADVQMEDSTPSKAQTTSEAEVVEPPMDTEDSLSVKRVPSDSEASLPPKDPSSDDSTVDEAWLGCVCGKNHRGFVFWLQCDGGCESWYNVAPKCVGFGEDEAEFVERWVCWGCKNTQRLLGGTLEVSEVVESQEPEPKADVSPEQIEIIENTHLVGDLVYVKKHSWPGVNVEEGVGFVTKVYRDDERNVVYDIKYAIGTTARSVSSSYVLSHSFE